MNFEHETPDWSELLAETRAALAHLNADELERLAARAEEILQACPDGTFPVSTSTKRKEIARQVSLLGSLLEATGQNMRVVRKARGAAEGNSPWAL
ncbi:MAG TPA: hypothetical protein VG714_04385 [Acidobacteriaceae bacterium]|nr:hypothetical protein [Acidobacteriaceae bacterium]